MTYMNQKFFSYTLLIWCWCIGLMRVLLLAFIWAKRNECFYPIPLLPRHIGNHLYEQGYIQVFVFVFFYTIPELHQSSCSRSTLKDLEHLFTSGCLDALGWVLLKLVTTLNPNNSSIPQPFSKVLLSTLSHV